MPNKPNNRITEKSDRKHNNIKQQNNKQKLQIFETRYGM